MSRIRGKAAAAAAAGLLLAAAGCGLGPGGSTGGEAELRVTRDYGAELVAEASVSDPGPSETVIRALDREAEITTRFGGRFVQSIEGIAGGTEAGRSFDWFFYVNGVESAEGAAEVAVRGGDRIWWDHRDWTDAMRVPAVVGSWPEPFVQAPAEGEEAPARVECAAAAGLCDEVVGRLGSEDVEADVERHRPGASPAAAAPRMVVGEWSRIRRDPAAALLDGGPATSGVFAAFERAGDTWTLRALDVEAAPAATLGPGSGLVAAVRPADDRPVWLVTGTDAEGVGAAVGLLDADELRDHYAVAGGPEAPRPLPIAEAG